MLGQPSDTQPPFDLGNVTALPDEMAWFALKAKARHEKSAARVLRAKGYEVFLPMINRRRRWSDRKKEAEFPLFSTYLFCRLDPRADQVAVLSTAGLLQIVGAGGQPTPVAEAEIAAVRDVVKSGLPIDPWPCMKAGQSVRIEHGPLCGLEGTLVGFRGGYRLVVSVTLLQRSVAVEIDEAWVARIRPAELYTSLGGTFPLPRPPAVHPTYCAEPYSLIREPITSS